MWPFVWPLSLSMFSRLYMLQHLSVIFSWLKNIPLYGYDKFCQAGYLHCFHLLVIINNAAVQYIHLYVVQIYNFTSLGQIRKSATAESYGNSTEPFEKLPDFFRLAAPFHIPTNMTILISPHLCQYVLPDFLILAIPEVQNGKSWWF